VLLPGVPSSSSPRKGLYNPKAFVTHAALLGQACAHCPKFLTAASRRSLGRLSVPVWLIILSDQLPIVALVGRYPTNQLIGRGPLLQHLSPGFPHQIGLVSSCGLSHPFGQLFPTRGQVTHALLSRPPLTNPKTDAFDLHVLGTPPAFTLSQDQTLHHESICFSDSFIDRVLALIPSHSALVQVRTRPRDIKNPESPTGGRDAPHDRTSCYVWYLSVGPSVVAPSPSSDGGPC
jgi:hypothetical protein